jgi:hypothetical protein
MGWLFRKASESFEQYRDTWDELNREQGNHLLLDSMFVGPLVRHFASERTLLGISNDPKNPGMALVERSRKGFWHTFQPSQAPLGLVLLTNRENAAEQIYALVRCLPGYALGFSVLQQDPDFTIFEKLVHDFRIDLLEYIKTSRLTLTGIFEDYWFSRGRDLVTNLEKRRRRLEKEGIQLQLVADRAPNRVVECIREYGKLESMGWKGRQGTAISTNNQQGAFYREMLENFCKRNEGVIYRLLLDGRTVASNLCIERDRMMIILKTSYSEDFKTFSPGFLIKQEIIRNLFLENKINVIEFYGRVREGWTTKWTDEIRSMYHINFYRYSWVATARRALKYGMRTVAG